MTEIRFTGAKCTYDDDGTWLNLHVNEESRQKAAAFVMSVANENRTYTAQIKRRIKGRSLDANAYFWVLCDRLSERTGLSKEEIYKHSIREIGGVSETYCGKKDAIDRLVEVWESKGLGWQVETFPSKLDGCVNAILYYGSSSYDTKQMSRLIDNIVQDCKTVGIETMTPAELSLLMDRWEEKNEQSNYDR